MIVFQLFPAHVPKFVIIYDETPEILLHMIRRVYPIASLQPYAEGGHYRTKISCFSF